jgi:predicted enzyme related to lactoylglutathione lyase
MGFEMPKVPPGSGAHPIALVVVSANRLAAAGDFYAKLFGWQVQTMSAELAGVVAPAGPIAALRCNIPDGFPGMVPYLRVPDVKAMLARIVAAGGVVEKAPWNIPMVGTLARFKDPGGTLYGLTDAMSPDGSPHLAMPIGANPKPPAGAICSLEMYAADGAASARFFSELFGWGTLATMPQYVAFDPGAGVGGVFQSHTPATPALAYLYATDVEAKLAEINAAGGTRQGPPMRLPGFGCFGYFKDPSGTSMGLIGP